MLLVLCCTLSGCGHRVDNDNSTTDSRMKDYDDQVKRQQAQLDAYDKQSKHAEEQLQAQADMQKRADALLVVQDTTSIDRGVRIGIVYRPGVRPGLVMLPRAGMGLDSVRAIVGRDLDYSDRFEIITLPAVSMM